MAEQFHSMCEALRSILAEMVSPESNHDRMLRKIRSKGHFIGWEKEEGPGDCIHQKWQGYKR